MRVAINGFGRIGRTVFRILDKRGDVEVVAINDLFDDEALLYLLHYDTVMGPFEGTLRLEGGDLVTAHGRTRMLCEKDPLKLPWGELGIDVVVESTGIFTSKKQLTHHLSAGAKRVLLTVPIISNASCTTNCLAPLAKVLHDACGIVEGVINTVHAYTNDQRLADVPHSDWRRSRAAAENIIPTSTGAAKAVGKVLPELQGRLDGIAARVPVPDGSVVDLFVELGKRVGTEDVHAEIRAAAESERMRDILQFMDSPVVSSDIIGNAHSSIFDAGFTSVAGGKYLKCLSWYDNEWGYSNRVCDLLGVMAGWD
jgi:glyceraldehyde 3-phosphate dehydrogenase